METKTPKRLLIFIITIVWFFSGWLPIWRNASIPLKIKTVRANPDLESLWSGSNSVLDLTLTSSTNANGSATGTWADADGRWAKNECWWEFVMQDSGVSSGTINNVSLYLKHYQIDWGDDGYLIQIYDGSTWLDVQSYTSGSGPPTSDTTNNWDVRVLGIDTWTKINAAKVRIFGNGSAPPEDAVDWFVDTVELRVDYTPAPAVAISITTDGAVSFNTLALEAVEDTTSSGINDVETVNVDSGPADLDVRSTNFTEGGNTWTLSTTNGSNQVKWEFSKNGTDWTTFAAADTLYALDTNVAQGQTRNLYLRITMPTTTDSYNQYSSTVTIVASAPS